MSEAPTDKAGATRFSGAGLIVLGIVSLFEASRLRDDWLGAKLMPAVVGVTLVLLGLAHLRGTIEDGIAWPDATGAGLRADVKSATR